MNVFDKVKVLHEDHEAIWSQFQECNQTLKEIIESVNDRLRNEREQTESLICSATQKATDITRSETIRRIAESEIEKLKSRTFSPTTEEVATFNEVMQSAQAALSDAKKTRAALVGEIRSAKEELDSIRKKSIDGGKDADLASRWLDDAKKKFDMLRESDAV